MLAWLWLLCQVFQWFNLWLTWCRRSTRHIRGTAFKRGVVASTCWNLLCLLWSYWWWTSRMFPLCNWKIIELWHGKSIQGCNNKEWLELHCMLLKMPSFIPSFNKLSFFFSKVSKWLCTLKITTDLLKPFKILILKNWKINA